MNPAGLIARFFKRKHNLPYIITEHWTGYLPNDGRYNTSKILKLSLPKIARKSSLVLPVSDDLKKALNTHQLGTHFKVLRNVVNTNKFTIQKDVKDRFLVVADLEDKQKNITGILASFHQFSKDHPEIKLSIAGGGPDEEIIKQKVIDLSLDKKITFHGRIPAEDLNNLLAKSYASILFSNYENLPCVIVESFSSGVPFIATNVGGIQEIINKDRGIIIQKGNQTELLKAMELVLDKNFNSETLREYALANFSYEEIGKQLNEIYKEVLG